MFIARQPIFDSKMKVFGYELLFRLNSSSSCFDGASSSEATANVIGGLFESGIDSLIEDKCAFVNFDEEFIHSNTLELIGSDRLVIEMLENTKVDSNLLERLNDLKSKGYRIALDDFVEEYRKYPLVPIADIIKFDLIATPLDEIAQEVKLAISQKKVVLAEKIETEETFLEAKNMGFHLFQGFFFSKPSIAGKYIGKTTHKAQYMKLISELKKPEPSYQSLAEIIEQDINLAYRLMRLIRVRSGDDLVYSIKRALTYMELEEIERWVDILMIQDLGKSKPDELMKISLIRAKFGEYIAVENRMENIKYEASMLGLFSTIDAMMDQNMKEALKDMAMPSSITEALVDNRGILFPIYELMLAYERGDWKKAGRLSRGMNMEEDILNSIYISAVEWAAGICEEICKD